MQARPWQALIMGVLIAFAMYLAWVVLMWPLVTSVLGVDQDMLMRIVSGEERSPKGFQLYKILQGSNQLMVWGLTGMIMIGWVQHTPNPLSLSDTRLPTLSLVAMVAMLASIPLVQLLQIHPDSFTPPAFMQEFWAWAEAAEQQTQSLLKDMLQDMRSQELAVNLIIFALIPALCEELFFRGFIQREFQRLLPPWAAILVTAALFSFIHLQFFGFFARFALGALLGFFFYRSQSLIPGILGHFSFNAATVIAVFMAPESIQNIEDAPLDSIPLGWIALSFAAVVGLGYLFYLQTSRQS